MAVSTPENNYTFILKVENKIMFTKNPLPYCRMYFPSVHTNVNNCNIRLKTPLHQLCMSAHAPQIHHPISARRDQEELCQFQTRDSIMVFYRAKTLTSVHIPERDSSKEIK